MNGALEKIDLERDFLTIDEAASILWEWRKYRNEVFYTAMYRWGAVVLLITLAPYLLPDIIVKLGYAVFLFPALAFLISAFAAYLTAVLYKLYKLADHKFRSLLGKYKPGDPANVKPMDKIFQVPLGLSIAGLFVFFAVGQLINVIVLYILVQKAIA